MDETVFASVYLADARLAAHATSATAVWLWSADGARILWANPAGCAALGAKAPPALLERRFAIGDPARAHIERLAETLPAGGDARLFRLRGFAGAAWSSLTCSCARFELGRTPAILVVATEPVGADVPLAERVRRLGFPEQAAVAAYAQDGAVLFATAAAEHRLAGARGLDAIGAAALAVAALATGGAQGDSRIGPVVLQRIGRGTDTVLLAGFPDRVAAAPQPAEPAAPEPKSNPALRRHPLRFVWRMDATGRFSLELGRIRRPHRRQDAGHIGTAVARNQCGARPRSARARRPGHRVARDLEQHRDLLADRRRQRTAGGGTGGPARVRPQPQFPGLSGVRRLPRHRAYRTPGDDTATLGLHAGGGPSLRAGRTIPRARAASRSLSLLWSHVFP